MFKGDETGIERDFQESLIRSRTHYPNYPFLKKIVYNVSWYAIDQMLEDMRFGSNIGWEDGRCICKVTTTMGLPCSHMIRNFQRAGKLIPIDAVDPFWRRLTFKLPPRDEGKHSFQEMTVFTDVQEKWEKASESGKQVIEASLKEIIYPLTSTKSEPTVNETPKVRPTTKKKEKTRIHSLHERIAMLYPPVKVAPMLREKQVHQDHYFQNPHYLKDMPEHVLPFILSTEDVAKDGNCGFHVVVEALGLKGSLEVGELDPISYVRDKMVTNLLKNQNMYKKMMTDGEFVELVNRIRPLSEEEYLVLPSGKYIVPSDRWMLMPKCGFEIAETFSCAV
ncbi:uncharacterized protein LOC113290403 [Papaver somniferum]|uniref:uncharacterized protein LOC113290403 n=1 Tax=Papaver somniferum TaxID=3469 RepID=UPI000E7029FB|nr:uncharacterized protein LOC113290403 [Papaver somniferum]